MNLRTILTTTAVALLMSGPALAQNAPPMQAPAVNPAMPAPAAPASQAPLGADTTILYAATDADHMATHIIGSAVYSSTASDADHFGDIRDIVLGNDGSVQAAIIGVGGFLGIGEKQVAVSFDALQFTTAADNTERYVLTTTREALEAAPEFVVRDERPVAAARPADPALMGAPAAPMADPAATAFDRSTMTVVEAGTLSADNLLGTSVIGPENQRLGEIGDIILLPDGRVDAVVVDFGGFLGIGEKKVAVGYDNLEFTRDANGAQYLWINATRDQLEAAPAYDEAAYNADRAANRLVVTM